MKTNVDNVDEDEDWERGVVVHLEWYEVEQAASVGTRRRVESLRQSKQDAHGFDGCAKWEIDIQSAAAEMAFAKLTRQYWDGSCNTFKRPDVGAWQVRWTGRAMGSLIIRPGDADDDMFVLLTGSLPTFRIIGCIKGSRAKRQDWLSAPNDRPPAYFVPQAYLRPIADAPTA